MSNKINSNVLSDNVNTMITVVLFIALFTIPLVYATLTFGLNHKVSWIGRRIKLVYITAIVLTLGFAGLFAYTVYQIYQLGTI